jgi:hypothetical protein
MQKGYSYVFFYHSSDALDNEIRRDLLSASAQLVGSMVHIISNTKTSNAKFEQHLENLTQAKDSKDVEQMITAIIENGHDFITESKNLENSILSSIKEIDALKQEFLSAHRESLVDSLTGLFNKKGFILTVENVYVLENRKHL